MPPACIPLPPHTACTCILHTCLPIDLPACLQPGLPATCLPAGLHTHLLEHLLGGGYTNRALPWGGGTHLGFCLHCYWEEEEAVPGEVILPGQSPCPAYPCPLPANGGRHSLSIPTYLPLSLIPFSGDILNYHHNLSPPFHSFIIPNIDTHLTASNLSLSITSPPNYSLGRSGGAMPLPGFQADRTRQKGRRDGRMDRT